MELVTESFDFLRYVPLCLAGILWLHHFYIRHTLSGYEEMKALKQWHDLPRYSATQNKEATLNSLIGSERKKVAASLGITIMFSVIGVLWFFYMS